MLTYKIQPNIFISYARDDGGDLSRHLRGHLTKKSYEVFLDSQLTVGSKWKYRIETAIDKCDVFVLIITARAISSNEVKEEYSRAMDKRKVLMLFKHSSVQIEDLPSVLKERNMHEFTAREELVRVFEEKFTEIDDLLTSDLQDPQVVYDKFKDLKNEFKGLEQEENIDKIKSYADDLFIPIITFLKKSPVLFTKEKTAIDEIVYKATKLSLDIGEKKEESSEVVFAKVNAQILRLTLAPFLDYLIDLFVKYPPEQRSQQLKSATPAQIDKTVQVKPPITEARNFFTISVDRDLSETRKYEELKQEIENQRIDIRFLYLTPESVDLWFKIIKFSDYKFNAHGRENIIANASDLVNIILEKKGSDHDHIDLIDLGVGAAVKDYYLLKVLLERMPQGGNRMNYVPLDYSIAILQKVTEYMDNLMDAYPNKLHIEGVLGDFYQLLRYKTRIDELSGSPRVWSLLGNILGNSDELKILTSITESMNEDDFFLLEVDLINNRTDDKLKEGFGNDDNTKNFLLTPILKHSPRYHENAMKMEDFTLRIDIERNISIIPDSITVVTSANYGENSTEKIYLVRSHKYDLTSIVDYLLKRWQLRHIKTYQHDSSCLLLLQKLPIESNIKDETLQEPLVQTQTLQ
jgi:uncharacterized SAM-dependent methyltransferase